MKKVIKSTKSYNPFRADEYKGWDQRDIDLHESIDWAARGYSDYPVPQDSFSGIATLYSEKGTFEEEVTFIKYLRANPIFAPYYGPEDSKPFNVNFSYVGPMYDGNTYEGYDIHDRYESSRTYDILSR